MSTDLRRLRVLLVAGLLGAVAGAQTPEIALEPAGQSWRVRLSCKQATALDVFSLLAERLGKTIEISDHTLATRLSELRLDSATVSLTPVELLGYLGGACDVLARLNEAEGKIVLTALPADDEPQAAAVWRTLALDGLLREDTEGASPERESRLVLQRLRLQAACGDRENALAGYDEFLKRFPEHESAPAACLEAAWLALGAGRPEASRFIVLFLDRWPDHREIGGAEILLAQSWLAAGRPSEATLMLERLNRRAGRRELASRDAVVAQLLLAQLYHGAGQSDRAVKILDQVRWRGDGGERDLLDRVPLYAGMCRRALRQYEQAIYELLIAAHQAPEQETRVRALVELARTYLDMQKPIEALAAARLAVRTGAAGAERIRAGRFESLAWAGLGLEDKAVNVMVEALELARGLAIDPARRQRLDDDMLRDLGNLLFGVRSYETARRIFSTLRTQSERAERATYMLALCEYSSGQYADALAALQSLGSAEDGALRLEIRKLAGDCYVRLGLYEHAIRTWNEESY